MFEWGKLFTIFLTSTVKLFYAPAASVALGFGFWTTFVVCGLGGTTGVLFFYFGGAWFLDKMLSVRRLRNRLREHRGKEPRTLKRFNRKNRYYVKLKQRWGAIGLAVLTPCIISIPIGTILAVRFFGRDKLMFPMLLLSVWLWTFILSYFSAFMGETLME